jgi:tetrahydromethanopterin S-methyltransferase subunit A
MDEPYYPWGGEYTICTHNGCVAVVLLTIDYTPPPTVALYGPLKTENIGVEKIIANVISNPHIRFLVLCGDDIRGHRSGSSLVALHTNGIDEHHRIIQAPGAIPYIENIDQNAILRFQKQIQIIDCIGEKNKQTLDQTIQTCIQQSPVSFGEPYIAIRIKPETTTTITDKRALHAKIIVNYLGKVKKRSEN